jgi:hypothetical protein
MEDVRMIFNPEIPENVGTVFKSRNVSGKSRNPNVPETPPEGNSGVLGFHGCSVYEIHTILGVLRQIPDFRKFRKMSGRFPYATEFSQIPVKGFFEFSWFHGCNDL